MKYDFVPPAQREKLIWIAVDFDGTIATSSWSADNPNALPGDVLPEVREKLEAIHTVGKKIVVHTSRGYADYEIIESYMNHHRLPFDKIICGKLLAEKYIDDRNSDINGPWH